MRTSTASYSTKWKGDDVDLIVDFRDEDVTHVEAHGYGLAMNERIAREIFSELQTYGDLWLAIISCAIEND